MPVEYIKRSVSLGEALNYDLETDPENDSETDIDIEPECNAINTEDLKIDHFLFRTSYYLVG